MTMPQPAIMIIDDEAIALEAMAGRLTHHGMYRPITCADPRCALAMLAQERPAAVVLDLHMPHIAGEKLLALINHDYPEIPVIVVTTSSDVETAVRLVQNGALDYLLKPVRLERLLPVLDLAMQVSRLRRPVADDMAEQLDHPEHFRAIITANPEMRCLFRYIEAVSPSSSPVLVTGETGTGKELVARAVHALSGRTGELVVCNVGGLDDTLFADALFGHRKGAFTGAHEVRRGLVERAADGTLFLDEIGDLSPASQVKLLRLLQGGDYLPVGADRSEQARVRVVTATSVDLEMRVDEGRFRRDLYYRLGGHRVHLPALRERREDIPALIRHFVAISAHALDCVAPTIPRRVLDLVSAHSFPGNIRELQAAVHDAVARRHEGQLSLDPFQRQPTSRLSRQRSTTALGITFPADLPSMDQTLDQLVDEALCRSDGNQAAAARLLGVTRQAMSQRVKARERLAAVR